MAACGATGSSGARMRRTSGRTTSSRTTRPSSSHHQQLDAAHDVVLGELQERHEAGRLGDRRCVGASAKRRLTTSTWSPRFWSKPIAVRTSAAMRSISSLLARLVGELALVVLGVDAVDQHRDRDAVDAAALGHLGLGGAGNLVVDDFLGLAALVARRAAASAGALLRAGQLVADGDLAVLAVAGRR